MQFYDIVGDIHGHATKLENLLLKMDYRLVDGVYKHASRKAIFVGDYIDRGSEETKTIQIVQSMVQNGSALAIMGNHEFNAICWATSHPEQPGEYLRKHTDKNFDQHQAFLEEFPVGSKQHTDTIAWFKTLPIYLDLEHIRIVHACWHQESIDELNKIINANNTLPDEVFLSASTKGNPHYQLIEDVVKAPEKTLPKNVIFKDQYGKTRTSIRVKWWLDIEPTYKNLALTVPEEIMDEIPDIVVDDVYLYQGNKPVFFGHYWMKGRPQIQSAKVACTDYSAAKDGDLIAYRWSGETNLHNDNFIW
jgi:hypothetical protein